MSAVHAQSRRPFRRSLGYIAIVSGFALGTSALLATPALAAQGPVGLGTADSFAVLAGSGITNTGATTITGDVGSFPTPTETGFGTVTETGTNHHGDDVAKGAKDDLVTAYNDAAGRTPETPVGVELGGTTLAPGVYTSPTLGLTGTLTLDGEDQTNPQFIFKAGSTLITEAGSNVVLINGAQACDVVWQVGSSATFKTDTDFVGNVLAQTSITAQTGATFNGRLLASDGAVTLDDNAITRADCAADVPPTPTPTPTPTDTPTDTITPTPTDTPTDTITPTPTGSVAPTVSASPTSSITPTPSVSPTSSVRPTPPVTVSLRPPGGGLTTSSRPKHGSSRHHRHHAPAQRTNLAAPSLPFTGLPAATLVGIAGLLVLMGSIALVTASPRRRRRL